MLWIKALHVISVIAWMAGLLYLPRLFVNHTKAEPGSALSEAFKGMESRLYRFIMRPSMIASWLFGLILVFYFQVVSPDWGWVWVKGAAILALTGIHFWLGAQIKAFEVDENRYSTRFYRYLNEVPTLLMIIIVVMVIVRPF